MNPTAVPSGRQQHLTRRAALAAFGAAALGMLTGCNNSTDDDDDSGSSKRKKSKKKK